MYKVETRKVVLVPNEDKRGAGVAADLLDSVRCNLNEMGFKSKDVVKVGNYTFRMAEIQRASAFCRQFSRAGITL